MPAKRKPVTAKKAPATRKKPVAAKAVPIKKKAAIGRKALPAAGAASPVPPLKKKYTVYIGASAFFPASSDAGYIDHFQDGRCTATANRNLQAPVVVPVGATLSSLSIHYTNTTTAPVLCLFLRLHADRVSPSGEIEMSFISLVPGVLPPDNFLTVTDTSFADGNIIKDRFLHYLDLQGTGDFGARGKVTVRGVSFTYWI